MLMKTALRLTKHIIEKNGTITFHIFNCMWTGMKIDFSILNYDELTKECNHMSCDEQRQFASIFLKELANEGYLVGKEEILSTSTENYGAGTRTRIKISKEKIK